MFFSVIPFSHSIGIVPLLYTGGDICDDELGIGSLVEIPYGNNLENGIITGIHQDSPIDMESELFTRVKTIQRLITSKKLLAPYQIHMICEISARYMIPIHRVLQIFLSRPILSRLEKKNYEQLQEKNNHNEHEKKGNIHIVQDGIVTPNIVNEYLEGSTIIILPDDFAMKPYQEYHKNRDDILFVTNDMGDIRKAQAWIDIANGSFSIIYGTRKILYYNLSQYNNIIYIEDSLGPDYWHYPIRIGYNDILRIFKNAHSTRTFTILTSIPTLSILTYFRDFTIKNI